MDSGFWMCFACTACIYGIGLTDASGKFGYDGKIGPEFWPTKYPACGGKHQSPINIAAHFVLEVDLPLLEFTGYDVSPEISTISNNGHTVLLELNSTHVTSVRGGPLRSEYMFNQLHFHWGANDSLGSEDTINGQRFPMELHIVSYKKEYGNLENASTHEDGLAVMAFFFEVADTENTAYTEIVDALPLVDVPDTYVRLRYPLSLASLMGENTLNYYTYHGSLTTPPCSEVVTWLDFEEPILLSHDQINEFRHIHSHEGLMSHNHRPTQPVGERTLWHTRGAWSDSAGASVHSVNEVLALLVTVAMALVLSQ